MVWGKAGCWACVIGIFSGPALAAPQYHVTDLGVFDPSAINNHGDVAGTVYYRSGNNWASVLYRDGAMHVLGGSPAASEYGLGLNDADQVVGRSLTDGAVMYDGSVRTVLGTTADGVANAINNSGQVVGYMMIAAPPWPAYPHAFRYSDGTLSVIGGENSSAMAINSAGDAIGTIQVYGEYHAALFHGGQIIDLDHYGWGWSRPAGINDLGQITGSIPSPFPNTDPNLDVFYTRAFVISNGVMTDLGALGGVSSGAAAINNRGEIIGGYATGPSSGGSSFLYSGGVMYDLPSLVDSSGFFWDLLNPVDINDNGWIVGSGYYNGVGHAVLLTPIPEPSTVASLLVVSIGLLGTRIRRRTRKTGHV